MIQEKRGTLKVWNASLILADRDARDRRHVPRALGDPPPRFTRSSRTRRWNISFVVLIGAMAAGSLYLCASSRREISPFPTPLLDSLLSREAVFLLQNMVLVVITAVIFWLDVLPAHLRGDHRHAVVRRATRAPAVRGADRAPARRCSPGSARSSPGGGSLLAKLRRGFAFPVAMAAAHAGRAPGRLLTRIGTCSR